MSQNKSVLGGVTMSRTKGSPPESIRGVPVKSWQIGQNQVRTTPGRTTAEKFEDYCLGSIDCNGETLRLTTCNRKPGEVVKFNSLQTWSGQRIALA